LIFLPAGIQYRIVGEGEYFAGSGMPSVLERFLLVTEHQLKIMRFIQ
jgi:hypothetical protein